MTANPFTLLESLVSWALGPAPVEATPVVPTPEPPPLSCLILGIITSLADEEGWIETVEDGSYDKRKHTLLHKATNLELSWYGWPFAPASRLWCRTMSLTEHEAQSISLAIDQRQDVISARDGAFAQAEAERLKAKLAAHFGPLGCPQGQPTITQAIPAQPPSL